LETSPGVPCSPCATAGICPINTALNTIEERGRGGSLNERKGVFFFLKRKKGGEKFLNGRKFWMRGEKREAEIKKQKTERKKKGGKFLNEGRISSVEKRETERGEQKKKREEEDLFERQRRESKNGREEEKNID
jgi:hypothetical protein